MYAAQTYTCASHARAGHRQQAVMGRRRRRKKKRVENVEEKKMEGKGNKERRRRKKKWSGMCGSRADFLLADGHGFFLKEIISSRLIKAAYCVYPFQSSSSSTLFIIKS